jgi:hypothetical protein
MAGFELGHLDPPTLIRLWQIHQKLGDIELRIQLVPATGAG